VWPAKLGEYTFGGKKHSKEQELQFQELSWMMCAVARRLPSQSNDPGQKTISSNAGVHKDSGSWHD